VFFIETPCTFLFTTVSWSYFFPVLHDETSWNVI